MLNVTLRQLQVFAAAAQHSSFARAAEELHLTAPAISMQIKELESVVGLSLFDRSGRALTLSTAGEYFVPRLLAEFRREHPGIEFRLEIGNRQALVEMLHRNQVDLAIMGRPPRELNTRAEPFAPNPLAMIASPEHPLARLSEVPPALLANELFLVREKGSGTRASMDIFFREKGIHPASAMEMPSNETIKQAVMANIGLGFLS